MAAAGRVSWHPSALKRLGIGYFHEAFGDGNGVERLFGRVGGG